MNKAITLVMAIGIAATPASWAAETPHAGHLDSRVRNVDYNAAQVYRLSVKYGYTLLIQFDEGESLEDGAVAMGDPGAWEVGPRGRNLLIKPTAAKAETNMTVITNEHTYAFDLTAKDGGESSMYVVRFRYPQERAAEQAARETESKQVSDVARRLPNKYEGVNWDYYARGARDLWPSRIYDNGQFTYITFAGNGSMPAVYESTASGDAIVNTHVEGNTIVVHKVAENLVLRNGGDVLCIVNRSYNPDGRGDETRSSAPGLERVIK